MQVELVERVASVAALEATAVKVGDWVVVVGKEAAAVEAAGMVAAAATVAVEAVAGAATGAEVRVAKCGKRKDFLLTVRFA